MKYNVRSSYNKLKIVSNAYVYVNPSKLVYT